MHCQPHSRDRAEQSAVASHARLIDNRPSLSQHRTDHSGQPTVGLASGRLRRLAANLTMTLGDAHPTKTHG